jgi:MoaA/NifB/PqqE/SkfB family radical SAM enzyme
LLRLKKVPFYVKNRVLSRERAGRKFCTVPWSESAVLSDGTVVCGCTDALKMMPLGNVEESSFEQVWSGKRYRRLRAAVRSGAQRIYLCSSCCFLCDPPSPERLDADFPLEPGAFPTRLHMEPTVRCNLRCPACGNDLAQLSRNKPDMKFETFRRVLDEVGPHIKYLNFYDYGETFIHKRAIDMIRHAKSVNSDVIIICSTNGHFFRSAEQQRAVIESGVDEIIFSVDGAAQEVYEKYRVGGRLDVVLKAMRDLVRMKQEMGRDKPSIMWRYILFDWNDSDDEMARAKEMAREIGVDQFRWLLTDHPPDGCSKRFVPGSPELERIKDELF